MTVARHESSDCIVVVTTVGDAQTYCKDLVGFAKSRWPGKKKYTIRNCKGLTQFFVHGVCIEDADITWLNGQLEP